MSLRALEVVLRLADARTSAALTYDDVMRWQDGERRALLEAGWLRDAGHARHYTCTDCERECAEEVQFVEAEGQPLRAFIPCSGGHGRIYLEPEALRRWSACAGQIVGTLCEELAIQDGPLEVVRGRLWWLGKAVFGAGTPDVFLARGAAWRDGAPAIGGNPRLQQCARALVLTLSDTRPDWLPGMVCLSLSRLLSLDGDRLSVDRECIERELARRAGRSPRAGQRFPTPPGVVWEQVAIVVTAGLDGAVVTAGSVTEPLTPDQMGMAYARQSAKFTGEWHTLVKLAIHGRITSEDREARSVTPKQIERLRAKLKSFLGIGGDPFKPYRRVESDDSYHGETGLFDRRGLRRRRLVGGYEPRFSLSRIRD
jgi:hypothetical protein